MRDQLLSDQQVKKLESALCLLPERQRDAFARSVKNRLDEYPLFTDYEVDSTIALVLSVYGVSAPRFFADQRRRA
jgi:hypothetical protein